MKQRHRIYYSAAQMVGRCAKTLGVPLVELFVMPSKGAQNPKNLPRGRKATAKR